MTHLLNGLLRWLGIMSAWLTGLMVLTTVLIVILRYAFGTGAIALQEAVVYTLQVDEHVRVDLFYSRFSTRTRTLIDVVGHILLLLPVSATLFVLSLDYVEASWRIRESSPEVGGLPAVFLLKTLIPLSAALLFLQGLALIASGIARLRTAASP